MKILDTLRCGCRNHHVDIQISAGTTYGNKALTVKDRDERRLILTAENNTQVDATLTPKAETLALRSKEPGEKARELIENSAERQVLERAIGETFSWLRSAPTAEAAGQSQGE